MNSTSLKLLGIMLFSMIHFTCAVADLPEFEKVVYKRSINNIENSISSFVVDLEYFRMKGDSTVAKNLNLLINQIIFKEKLSPNGVSVGLKPEEYMQIAIQGFEKHRRKFPNDRGYTQQTKSEVTWSDEKLISMEIVTYRYTGGAHGHTYHEFLNVDPKSGERIYILDFITDMESLITSVHEKLITALPEGQKQMWNQVRIPKQMGMTKEGLKLVYNEYEILSYGEGRTEIIIPMDELKAFSADLLHEGLRKESAFKEDNNCRGIGFTASL